MLLEGDPSGFTEDTDPFSAPGAYTYGTSLWSDVAGKRAVLSGIGQSNNVAFTFFGTDGSGEICQIRIWGYSAIGQAGTKYTGVLLCQLTITLGASATPSGTPFGDTVRFARFITPTRDRTLFPGIRVVGEEPDAAEGPTPADSPALMILDGLGFIGYIIEGRMIVPPSAPGATAAASLGVAYRLL